MADTPDERNYTVGYGRPPQHTRFRKGQSGNPKGRPPASQNLGTVFQRILDQPVTVREGDQSRRITKAEAMLQALVLRAMKGETRATALVLNLSRDQGLLTPPAAAGEAQRGGVLIVPGMLTDPDAWARLATEQQRQYRGAADDPDER